MSQENTPAEVFLSYSRQDEVCAARLERDLQAKDIDVWRDLRAIQGGHDWENEIRSAIRASSSLIYLGTPAARDSGAVRGEVTIARTYNKPIHPVFAAGKDWVDVATLELIPKQYFDIREGQYQEGVKQLADRIRQRSQSDLSINGSQEEKEGNRMIKPNPKPGESLWRRVVRALLGQTRSTNGPQGSVPPPKPPNIKDSGPRNPYKGLRPFMREDAQDFFGRKEVVDWMVKEIKHILDIERRHDRRQEPRFVTVVGPSGSGKSSVVMAGLLPRLQKGEDIPDSNLWVLLPTVCPGKKPLGALAQALSQGLSGDVSQDEILGKLQDRSICALHYYAEEIAKRGGSRVILFVDQFEELFTETSDDREREQFIHQLITAATKPENKVIVMVTLRVDFSDHPMHYPLLHPVIEAHRIAIPPMTVENLRAVIEGPAGGVGLRFEENLVGDLLFDIHGQEENLPLLQFTLTKLFEERDGNCLTRQAYETIGCVTGALDQHAEETYNHLPSDEHRRLAEVLFTRLINPGGLEQDATRRRVPALELTFPGAEQNHLMQETIQVFIEARLITANRSSIGDATTHGNEGIPIYEISHEALISAWAQFAGWITTARDDMLVRQTLDNDMERWERQHRSDGQLYTGDRLAEARAWAERTIPTGREEEFLRASDRYQRHQRRTRNIPMFASLGFGFLMLLVIAGSIGYNYYHRALSTTVTTLQDSGSGSLRQVIQDAPLGSTITFGLGLNGGRIVLSSGDLVINKNLILIGPDSQQIIISNNGKSGDKVHIEAGASATFKNLSFQDSHVSGTAFIDNEGDLTLDHCSVIHNTSDYNGGGIANLHGTLTITNSEVRDNEAQRNGGGIYSWDGALTLTGGSVHDNSAGNNGGGIYELSGRLSLNKSMVFGNKTRSSDSTSNGGGISVLDGELILDSSMISGNDTNGYGGGIALLGTVGLIDRSVISGNKANGQGAKGGGLAVEKNSESGNASLAVITGMEVKITNRPKGSYYVWGNTAPSPADADILGGKMQLSTPVTVQNDTSELNGSPAPSNPPEQTPHFLGTINLDEYCHAQYPRGTVSLKLTNAENIQCVLLSGTRVVRHVPIDPGEVCRWQYNQPDVIDRLADYYDPSSWQCYKHEVVLGPITPYLNEYCQSKHYKGIYPNVNGTAYGWDCQGQDNKPIGIAVAGACQWHYGRTDAFDRITNFNDPNGWECLAPKKVS